MIQNSASSLPPTCMVRLVATLLIPPDNASNYINIAGSCCDARMRKGYEAWTSLSARCSCLVGDSSSLHPFPLRGLMGHDRHTTIVVLWSVPLASCLLFAQWRLARFVNKAGNFPLAGATCISIDC
ncbi:hypothetical protein OIU85_022760 [Salix viminalis]|uniref:Uncharacterized protein n=1 Tax=Salix viminalis TaxID=40686 RepID=A0A9Q0Z859_SALVM|nr:hypothetical protein OIU85_022760 [Salix viminalis]